MIEEIKIALKKYNGEWKEKNSIWEFSFIIADRKSFLSKKKLTYYAKIKIIDNEKLVKFSEMLVESGFGFSSGQGFDSGMSTGFGFKTESYNTFGGARQGTITEQSNLFGKKYDYKFNYKEIRTNVEKVVEKLKYKFEYQILPLN